MKLNRRGFTLVELLVTIVIIGLVVGFTVFGIIKLTKDSEDKTVILSEDNLKEAARIYSAEASSDSWKKNDEYDYDAFCTTIGELMNKGFLDKNSSITGGYTKDSYIIVKRNKVTLAVDSEDIVSNVIGDEYNQICTGQVSNENNIIKPEINDYVSYTDRIEVSFNEGEAPESSIKDYKCLYGESTSNINKEGIIEGNKCLLDGLKNNKQYYVFIYMNTNKGSSVLADGSREYSTKDFTDTTFVQNGNKVNITYKDDNIYGEGYHYFKSGISGTSSENVLSCDLNNNKFICNESTNLIEKDRWYKIDGTGINITYPEENNKFNIATRICDDSNNCKENSNSFQINKYVVKFYRNGAVSVDGSTSEYIEKYCLAEEDASCNISSPSFNSQVGYSVVGWNSSSSATSSEWNIGTTKEINSNLNYYAISKINTVNIKYNVNGGEIATSSNSSGTWTKNSSGTVLLNGSILTTIVGYGENLGSDGLNNYNNSSYLSISIGGYGAVSGSEWKCLSGDCVGKAYSHVTIYNASDFCDAANGDCTVELGVNWTPNTYTVTYNANGGSGTMAASTATYDSNFITRQNTFTRSGYTFNGWNEKADGSGTAWSLSAAGTYESGKYWKWTGSSYQRNITLYAQWTPNTYTVTYNANGGSGTMATSTATYDSNFITRQNTFTRSGYTFNGWNEKADGSGTAWSLSAAGTYESGKSWKWTGSSYQRNITLYAQWITNTSVYANKFACENSRLAVYYVTVCSGNTCTYTKKNGLDNTYSFDLDDTTPTWSINETSYVDSLDSLSSSCSYSTKYVTASSSMNCRSGASTDASIERTWSRCTAIYVYPTTTIYRDDYRWYYSKTYGCYLSGALLSSSKPSDCDASTTTGTSTITGTCVCEKTAGGTTSYDCSKNNLESSSDCSNYCNSHQYSNSMVSSTCAVS